MALALSGSKRRPRSGQGQGPTEEECPLVALRAQSVPSVAVGPYGLAPSGLSVEVLSLLLQALRQMFIVGRQFDERFPYERAEALARQSLAFLRLSMELFGSCSAWFHERRVQRRML